MSNEELLKKIYGEIRPEGSTAIDGERMSNLEEWEEIADIVVSELYECARFCNDRLASRRNIGKCAMKKLKEIKDTIEECIDYYEEKEG